MARRWVVHCVHCGKPLFCDPGDNEVQCAYPYTGDVNACGCGQVTWLTWSNNHPFEHRLPPLRGSQIGYKQKKIRKL